MYPAACIPCCVSVTIVVMKRRIFCLLLVSAFVGQPLLAMDPPEWLHDGLVAYYPFDRHTQDMSGGDNHGTVVGTYNYLTQIKGTKTPGIVLENGSYVVVGNQFPLGGSARTVSAWITLDDPEAFSVILGYGNPDVEQRFQRIEFGMGAHDKNGPFLGFSKAVVIRDFQFEANRPYHVVWSYSEGSAIEEVVVHVDGSLISGLQYYERKASLANTSELGVAAIGGLPNTDFDRQIQPAFSGVIDELRIYDRALSAQEARQLYHYDLQFPDPDDQKQPPVIYSNMAIVSAEIGQSIVFSLNFQSTSPRDIRWFKDGQPIGILGSSFTLDIQGPETAGVYSVMITNDQGTANKDVLTVVLPSPLEILTQSESMQVEQGKQVSFDFSYQGSPVSEVQWFKDGVSLLTQTETRLSLGAVSKADAGIYHFIATNESSSVTGDFIVLDVVTNQPPTALDVSVVTDAQAGVTFQLKGQDPEGDGLVYRFLSQPSGGLLSTIGDTVVYVPGEGFSGVDSWQYVAFDGNSDSLPGTIRVEVRPLEDPNQAPEVDSSIYETELDGPILIKLSANDPDGDALEYIFTEGPSNGEITGVPPSLLYTPEPGFVGTDVLQFKVSDGELTSVAARVSIIVSRPEANGGSMILSNVGKALVKDRLGLPADSSHRVAVFDLDERRISRSVTLLGGGIFSAGTVILDEGEGSVRLLLGAWSEKDPAVVGFSEPFEIILGGDGVPPRLPGSLPVEFSGIRIPSSEAATIVAHPSSQVLVEGVDLQLDVQVQETGGVTFQWLHDGVPLAGQQSSSLQIRRIQLGQAGGYHCEVRMGANVVSSEVARIQVVPQPGFQVVGLGAKLRIHLVPNSTADVYATVDFKNWTFERTLSGSSGAFYDLPVEGFRKVESRFYSVVYTLQP
jgi:hypothetical protein